MKSFFLISALIGLHYPTTQIYLPSGAIDSATSLPAPPAPGSPGDERDYAELFQFQKTRTAVQCARAASEVDPNLEDFYGPAHGPLSEKQVQQWKGFFDNAVRSDTNYYVQKVKTHWQRPRPYIANSRIHPCIRTEGKNRAYPSGHAAIAEVYALILEKLIPSQKAVFEARARQIGRDRVIGGVHHPTDVLYGRKLGKEIYQAFMQSAKFKKALAALLAPTEADRHAEQH